MHVGMESGGFKLVLGKISDFVSSSDPQHGI